MKTLKIKRHLAGFMAVIMFIFAFQFTAYADVTYTKADVSVNDLEISSQGAVVIDAGTGAILYGKNEKTQYYPASITKLMTALLVLERCDLGETVTFSEAATTNLESGAVTLSLTAGDKLTVEQCLYGLLLKSANEVANGLAEHVSGSVSAFADLMNQKAVELGCTNTHFVNPNGLNDPNHLTTPYDMALIGRAAFANPTLCKIDTTFNYQFPATINAGARLLSPGHKMLNPSDSRYYEGIIGGKTGYTSLAGNTLVTAAERDGVRLIAVVMKSSSTHYEDTKALLDYGFARMSALANSGQTITTEPGVSTDAAPASDVSAVSGPGYVTETSPENSQVIDTSEPGSEEEPTASSPADTGAVDEASRSAPVATGTSNVSLIGPGYQNN